MILVLLLSCVDVTPGGIDDYPWLDHDGDGFDSEAEGDCDDTDATVYPGAPELCDGVDNDCDPETAQLEEDVWFLDSDGDGFGVEGDAATSCFGQPGRTAVPGDCDDGDTATYPDAPERCDGEDNDCDGAVDETPEDSGTWFDDSDGDGFGDPEDERYGCHPVEGFALDGDDCDDSDAAVFPGAPELCDGVDNDCDDRVDDDDDDVDTSGGRPYYPDVDLDGVGDIEGAETYRCDQAPGFSSVSSDCDDNDARVGGVVWDDPMEDASIGYDAAYFEDETSGGTVGTSSAYAGTHATQIRDGQDYGFRTKLGALMETGFTIDLHSKFTTECNNRNPTVHFETSLGTSCRVVCDGDQFALDTVPTGVPASIDTWYRLRYTHDPAAGTTDVYIDDDHLGSCSLSWSNGDSRWVAKHNDDSACNGGPCYYGTSYYDEFRACELH